jgi:4-hydroxybenzoyl-CoA thioesterase
MQYHRTIRVEFNHCDPAGIVFYPRYFEMLNSVVENFFRDVALHPFEAMMQDDTGVPTARVEMTYSAPSRLGEVLTWHLTVARLGRAALDLTVEASGNDLKRLTAEMTVVHIKTGRPLAWPEAVRARIAQFAEIKDEP